MAKQVQANLIQWLEKKNLICRALSKGVAFKSKRQLTNWLMASNLTLSIFIAALSKFTKINFIIFYRIDMKWKKILFCESNLIYKAKTGKNGIHTFDLCVKLKNNIFLMFLEMELKKEWTEVIWKMKHLLVDMEYLL